MNAKLVLCLLTCIGAASAAQAAAIPSECESASELPNRLYSYFGGVATFSLRSSAQTIFSGESLELTIGFQPSVFSTAGVGIGTLGISAPDLGIAPDADTFSLTIQGPPSGVLSFYVLIREDDNADGVIDLALGDDEWQSPEMVIPAGAITTINIPANDFVDTGAGSGNGIQEFGTTPSMAMIIDIHSSASYPGGLITSPVTLLLDHVGFYAGAQAPPLACAGDLDGNGATDVFDFALFVSNFGSAVPTGTIGDLDNDGDVDVLDFALFVPNFGCEP